MKKYNNSIEYLLITKLISKRTYNVCKYNNLFNEDDIYTYGCFNSFEKLRNCGKKSIQELNTISKKTLNSINFENDHDNDQEEKINNTLVLIDILFKINESELSRKIILVKLFFHRQELSVVEILKIFIRNKEILSPNSISNHKYFLKNKRIDLKSYGNSKLIELSRFIYFIINLSELINNRNEILIKGFKKRYFDFVFYNKNKIADLNSIIKSISLKFNDLLNSIKDKNLNCLKFSIKIVFPQKDVYIFWDFISGLSNKEIGKINNFTSERIRQKIELFLSNSQLIELYKFLINNGFQKYDLHYDSNEEEEIIVDNTNIGKGRGAKNGNYNKLKEFLNKINNTQSTKYDQIKIYQILNIKKDYSLKYTFSNFSIRHDIFLRLKDEIILFYNQLYSKNKPIKTNKLTNEFLLLISKYKNDLFPENNVFIEHPYTYYTSKITIPFLCELSILCSNNKTKTLRIEEIFNWIKNNFPNKKLKTIEGMRGALINSKNIIAFGKTGNYGLKKDFGVNKSSELSTKNILKVILNKKENPLTLEFLEDEVQKMNPFLKDRVVAMIIDINPKLFIKYKSSGSRGNPMFIGLKGKKYSKLPVDYDSSKLYDYLRSKNLSQEWVSLVFLINTFKIPRYQIKDFLHKNDYFIVNKMISLSTGIKKNDMLIRKLVFDENLIKKINKFLTLDIKEKVLFKNKLKKIINLNYQTSFENNDISKIINFII